MNKVRKYALVMFNILIILAIQNVIIAQLWGGEMRPHRELLFTYERIYATYHDANGAASAIISFFTRYASASIDDPLSTTLQIHGLTRTTLEEGDTIIFGNSTHYFNRNNHASNNTEDHDAYMLDLQFYVEKMRYHPNIPVVFGLFLADSVVIALMCIHVKQHVEESADE